jgi:molybdenum cofactor biosynthesis enzyme MoaA
VTPAGARENARPASRPRPLADPFRRGVGCLRIPVTDRGHLRDSRPLPRPLPARPLEAARLARSGAGVGVAKARPTGGDRFDTVWRGARGAPASGFDPFESNMVVMGGIHDDEVGAVAAPPIERPVRVGFFGYTPAGVEPRRPSGPAKKWTCTRPCAAAPPTPVPKSYSPGWWGGRKWAHGLGFVGRRSLDTRMAGAGG